MDQRFLKRLERTESILRDLPKINDLNSVLSDTDQIRMVECIVRLFSNKTGLECE